MNRRKRCPLHHRGLDATVGNQEIDIITGKFCLIVQNEAGRRLTELCQENTLIIANTFFQQYIFLAAEVRKVKYSQQKQDLDLILAQIMGTLFQNKA